MIERDDKKLIRRCLKGETEVFGVLVERYQKPLYNKALLLLGRREDAKDVTQTVFIKAYDKLEEYNPKYKFFSWIYRMLVNEAINYRNRLKGQQSLNLDISDLGKNPEEVHLENELRTVIADALMELTLDYRLVVVFRYFGNLTYKEISYVLDLPEKTVKSRLYSARQRLVEILQSRGIFSYEQ